MNLYFELFLFIALCRLKLVKGSDEIVEPSATGLSTVNTVPCSDNTVVNSWCDASRSQVKCFLQPDTDLYACLCETDPSECPDDCIDDTIPTMAKKRHSILCQGIPNDEPNFILKNKDTEKLPLHHCENNALVANWCNEATLPGVECLLLPSLDEYVCSCISNVATCPSECVGGKKPDRKTRHAVRCQGIPEDKPNYIV